MIYTIRNFKMGSRVGTVFQEDSKRFGNIQEILIWLMMNMTQRTLKGSIHITTKGTFMILLKMRICELWATGGKKGREAIF